MESLHLLEGLQRARREANLNTLQTPGLEVDSLELFSGSVGMAPVIGYVGPFSGKYANSGHMVGTIIDVYCIIGKSLSYEYHYLIFKPFAIRALDCGGPDGFDGT